MTLRDAEASSRAVFLALVVMVVPVSSGGQQNDRPLDSGLVERADVTLTLLDIDATDKAGRPLPGLSADDFKVRLNGRIWPIYSVDDLCSCGQPAPTGEREAGAETAVRDTPPRGEERDVYGPTPNRFVLYFDFSQLQLEGRARAVQEGKRWIRESMLEQDQAMVAAFSTAAGLRELSGFTSNREELLAIIDEAYAMGEMIDPFPEGFDTRQRDCSACCRTTCPEGSGCGWCDRIGWLCADCCPICGDNASDEYFHGRRSLNALRRLLIDLQDEPGRKHLMLFHQNGNLYPARFYPGHDHRSKPTGEFWESSRAHGSRAKGDTIRSSCGPVEAYARLLDRRAQRRGSGEFLSAMYQSRPGNDHAGRDRAQARTAIKPTAASSVATKAAR